MELTLKEMEVEYYRVRSGHDKARARYDANPSRELWRDVIPWLHAELYWGRRVSDARSKAKCSEMFNN